MLLSPEVGMALFGLGMLCVGAGTMLLWMSGRYGRGRKNHQISAIDPGRVQAPPDPGLSGSGVSPSLQVPHPMMTVLDPHEPLAIARPEFADGRPTRSERTDHGINSETRPLESSSDSLDGIVARTSADGPDDNESSVTSIPVRREHTRHVSGLRESVTLPVIPEAREVSRKGRS